MASSAQAARSVPLPDPALASVLVSERDRQTDRQIDAAVVYGEIEKVVVETVQVGPRLERRRSQAEVVCSFLPSF